MHCPILLLQIFSLIAINQFGISTASIFYSRPAALNAQLAVQIGQRMDDSANVIPGGSPFFYMDDPSTNFFSIRSISITPTPCQIGLPCDIEARGIFREDLDSIELNFDIEARMKNGQSAKLLAVKDNMCDWATVTQGHNRASCPPRKGAGTISWSVALVQGWIMEATYMIDLELSSGARELAHVGARMVLADLDNKLNQSDIATS